MKAQGQRGNGHERKDSHCQVHIIDDTNTRYIRLQFRPQTADSRVHKYTETVRIDHQSLGTALMTVSMPDHELFDTWGGVRAKTSNADGIPDAGMHWTRTCVPTRD